MCVSNGAVALGLCKITEDLDRVGQWQSPPGYMLTFSQQSDVIICLSLNV